MKTFLLFLLFTAVHAQYDQNVMTCIQQCLPQSSKPPNIFPPKPPTLFPPKPPSPFPPKPPSPFPPKPPSPSPPIPIEEYNEEPSIPVNQSLVRMTRNFPLGRCRMTGPSLPYELKFEVANETSICFRINEVERYDEVCSQYNIYSQCNDMIGDLKKLVIWYNQIDACGFQYTITKKTMNVFPWQTANGNRAARYRFISPTGKRSGGDVNLFKYQPFSRFAANVEVTIARTNTFKHISDSSMNGYMLCLDYDKNNIDLLSCISNEEPRIKYSFYDPMKSLCTSGSILL